MSILKRGINLVIAIPVYFIGLILMSCSSNPINSSEPLELSGFSWGSIEIEGAINADGSPRAVDASTSTWTFRQDGTYTWFLFAPPFYDLNGNGTYTFRGDTLLVSGIVANLLIGEIPQNYLILTFGNDTFSFRDDDGDRWTYAKIN